MREEKAKLDCQQRLAHQDLLLRKDLDATGLSELYRKLSAASQVLLPPPQHTPPLGHKPHSPFLRRPGSGVCMQTYASGQTWSIWKHL